MVNEIRILLEENYHLIFAGTALLVLILSLLLVREMHKINRKLNRMVLKIQDYVDTVMQEPEEEPQPTTEELIKYVEKDLLKNQQQRVETEKKQQEEEVFNAVLKEYFP